MKWKLPGSATGQMCLCLLCLPCLPRSPIIFGSDLAGLSKERDAEFWPKPWKVCGNITNIWCIHLQGEFYEIWISWRTNTNWWLGQKRNKSSEAQSLRGLTGTQMDFFLTVAAQLQTYWKCLDKWKVLHRQTEAACWLVVTPHLTKTSYFPFFFLISHLSVWWCVY